MSIPWRGPSPHDDGRIALRVAAGLALTRQSDARTGLNISVERHVEELPRVRVRAVTFAYRTYRQISRVTR